MSLASAISDDESGTNGQHVTDSDFNEDPPAELRASAPTRDPSLSKKTEPDYGMTEIHGAEEEQYPAPPIEQ